MKRIRGNFLAILGIIVAIVGIVVPILLEYFRTRSAIELQLISFSTLVEKTDQLDKLTITYNGENLNFVSKADFVLINTGRIPIVEQDLVSPPRIIFPKSTKILDVKIDVLQPSNLIVYVDIDPQNNAVIITFPLLNPNEYVHFSVLTNSKTIDFDAKARIIGIQELVVNKTLQTNKVTRPIPWTAYVIAIVSIFLLFLSLRFGLPQATHERRLKQSIANKQFIIPENAVPKTYIDIVILPMLDYTPKDKRIALISFLKTLPQDVPVNKDQYTDIQNRIYTLMRSTEILTGVIAVIILSFVGILYVIAQILSL